jgi:hypothetical protein
MDAGARDGSADEPKTRAKAQQPHIKGGADIMNIGTFLLMLAFAYGIGVFWYDLLPGRLPEMAWRTAAYPFAAIVIAQSLVQIGPAIGGLYILPAIVGALIGVIIDWIVTSARRPTAVMTPETRLTEAPAR